jgi:hypothetical protein
MYDSIIVLSSPVHLALIFIIGCLLPKDAVRVKGSSNVTSGETFKHGENVSN